MLQCKVLLTITSCFSTSKDISKEASDWVRYLVANLNGDVSFLSPSIASSEDLHSSQPASSMELEMSYRHSPRSIVRLSSANSGSPKSSQALASAVPQPSPPLSSAAHIDLSDGKILTTMEWLMVFAKVPLKSMVFQWFFYM